MWATGALQHAPQGPRSSPTGCTHKVAMDAVDLGERDVGGLRVDQGDETVHLASVHPAEGRDLDDALLCTEP